LAPSGTALLMHVLLLPVRHTFGVTTALSGSFTIASMFECIHAPQPVVMLRCSSSR
jgi:hypothetical protein